MAALVVPGAPVSVLVDHGITESLVEKLNEAQITTVEQLGAMTPEQLEEIPGIGPKMVERIQAAVVAYYGQFENQMGAPAAESPVEAVQPQSVTIKQDSVPEASAPGTEKGEQA
jgi:N utilization substance protein A